MAEQILGWFDSPMPTTTSWTLWTITAAAKAKAGKQITVRTGPVMAVRNNAVIANNVAIYGKPAMSWWCECDVPATSWKLNECPVVVALIRPPSFQGEMMAVRLRCGVVVQQSRVKTGVVTLMIVDEVTFNRNGRSLEWPPPEVPLTEHQMNQLAKVEVKQFHETTHFDLKAIWADIVASSGGDGASLVPARFTSEGGIVESRN